MTLKSTRRSFAACDEHLSDALAHLHHGQALVRIRKIERPDDTATCMDSHAPATWYLQGMTTDDVT